MTRKSSKARPIVDIQIATADDNVPSEEEFQCWVAAALPENMQKSELTIRLVSESESTQLNGQYRNKSYPTNVLSFPSGLPEGLDVPFIGDLIICVAQVEREALEQNKPLTAHWAHLVIHGTLHLLGYDHIENEEAAEMEDLEVEILHKLGFANPYEC